MFFAQNIMAEVEGLGYGYLYNWYAVSHLHFAPTGWHVPTESDFQTMETFLGLPSDELTNVGNRGTTEGGLLKEIGYTYWDSPNTDATNTTGFSFYGGGKRDYDTGEFVEIKLSGYLWSSTIGTTTTYMRWLKYNLGGITRYKQYLNNGYSIRLIKDSTTLSDGETSTMTDYDGNVYDTICIGTQEWTAQNWKCTKLNDGTPLTKVTNNTTWANAGAGDLYYCAYNNDESYV